MNNWGSTGIISIALLSSFLVVGATSSVMFDDSDELAEYAQSVVNDALEEVTSYLKIEEVIGKYYNSGKERRVERILVFVKQFISSNINLSDLTIKLQNDKDVMLLSYSGHTSNINSEPMFSHKIWQNTSNNFSIIVNIDSDRSLLDYNIMNKDTCYLAINLPDQFFMKKKDSLKISLIPGKGITSSIVIETPSLHISNIISFGEV